METKDYTLIYRVKSFGKSHERKFKDLHSAEFCEIALHKYYGDSVETLIVEY